MTHEPGSPHFNDDRQAREAAARMPVYTQILLMAALISAAGYWMFAAPGGRLEICPACVLPGRGPPSCPACFGFEPVADDLYVERTAVADDRAKIEADTKEARARVAAFFGIMTSSASIFVCITESCYARAGAGGNRTRVESSSGLAVIVSPASMRSTVLAHELTHLEFHYRVGSHIRDVPAWFDEGLAVYVSRDVRYLTPDEGTNGCAGAGAPDSRFSAHEFDVVAEADDGPYAAAACRVRQWMAARGGRQAVIELIGEIKSEGAYTFAP